MAITDPRFAEVVADAPLAYVSDYLSFVGADARGRVCFALDTNRGRDGGELQADHLYAVLHDEHSGWAALEGTKQRYAHPGPDVELLADSPWFAFDGSPDAGLVVTSRANALRLRVDPLADRLVGRDATTLFAMRSAAAELQVGDRVVAGRVIYGGLATTEINLLSRRTFASVLPLEFLYLLAGDGTDLYLQKVLGDAAMAGLPPQTGFDAAGVLDGLDVETTGHELARGLHRWPAAWRATWPDGRAELRTVSRTVIGHYGLAGVAMAVVEGELTRPDGTTTSLSGLGELLAAGPLLRLLRR